MFALIKRIGNFYKNQRNIRQKILLVVIPLAIVPLLILTFSVVTLSGSSLKNQIEQANEDIAREAAREIRLYVEGTADILFLLSEILGKANLSPIQKQFAISKVAINTRKFNYIKLTDEKGMEVLTSDQELALSNINGNPLFTEGKKGLYISRDITINPYTKLPQINVSVPVYRLNKFAGVLVASVNLRRMWEVVNSIKFGKTGKAYVVNPDGGFLSHRDEKYVLSEYVFPDKSLLNSARDRDVVNKRTRNFTTEDVFCSCAYIKPLNIFVIVEKTATEALGSIRLIIILSSTLLLLLIALGVLLSVSMTRNIVHPIHALVNGFKRVAGGDLDEQIAAEGKDEIAFLTKGFNKMISELKTKREYVLTLQERLKASERLSTIGAVVSRVAHEIKKPLASLKVLASSLDKADNENGVRKKTLQFIPVEIDRLTRIVDDTLNVVRRAPRKMEHCMLRDLLEDLTLLVGDNIRRQSISFSCRVPENGLSVFGSRDHLFQVFLNLVNNAIEVMPDGGEITIDAEEIQDGNFVEISVKDTGPGISEENLQKIFVPFVTFKKGGTGIGLAVVKQIIKEHMGKIEVSSQVGLGTTFTIHLPKQREVRVYENSTTN